MTSSNFPLWNRNLNTGGDNVTGTEWTQALNAVHHGPGRLSRVELSVVP